jgi:hypothetical protein
MCKLLAANRAGEFDAFIIHEAVCCKICPSMSPPPADITPRCVFGKFENSAGTSCGLRLNDFTDTWDFAACDSKKLES